ncbi:MAG: [acyl-carrier-protein] S-malonyltransferase [Chloroflexi bacterium]|nr:[acyl-carrier-protein] S-malonyltransferase [Chloroflexota bacterium]
MKFIPQNSAFVFPGQGSQKVGMGQALAAHYPAAKAIFEEADELLGFALSTLAWEGPEDDLNDTINTQPALLVHSVAALRVFKEQYPDLKPAFVAGHSLGELSALVAAEALDFPEALELVRRRGELMKRAGEDNPGGMAAILGLDIHQAEMAAVDASINGEIVEIANDNCPGQVVISGHSAAVERAIQTAKEFGARRALPLAVSIAAHSHLMAPAQKAFTEAINESGLRDPVLWVIGNVEASTMDDIASIRSDLQAQLTSRVRWTQSVQFMRAQGVRTFIELGSGSVLTGLLKRIDPDAQGIALGEPADFEKLAGDE